MTHAYPRWDGDVPGAFIERLILALARRGHTLAVVAPADAGQGGWEERHGIHVERVRYAPPALETLAYRGTMLADVRAPQGLVTFTTLVLQLARATRRLAHSLKADLIHAHWWVPAGIAISLPRRPPMPRVVTLHGTDVALLEWLRPARWIATRVLRGAAAVTAVSTYLAHRASELARVRQDRITVAPMPLDASLFAHISQGGRGIVTVGRLTRQKRLGLLLEAVARIAAEGLSLPLTIVGDGPERRALERLAQDLGLAPVVQFTGAVEPERIPQILRDADVFAFPAKGEGLGLAAAEALLAGIPVVATRDGGGVTDLVREAAGGRLATPDAPSFAAAIRAVLADPDSRAAAAREGAALRARLQPDAAAQAFEAIYERALRRPRPSS